MSQVTTKVDVSWSHRSHDSLPVGWLSVDESLDSVNGQDMVLAYFGRIFWQLFLASSPLTSAMIRDVSPPQQTIAFLVACYSVCLSNQTCDSVTGLCCTQPRVRYDDMACCVGASGARCCHNVHDECESPSRQYHVCTEMTAAQVRSATGPFYRNCSVQSAPVPWSGPDDAMSAASSLWPAVALMTVAAWLAL